MRLLFCIPTTQLSGGVKVIFEIAQGLARGGDSVHVFSYAGQPKWFSLDLPLIEAKDFRQIEYSNYDWVFVSNAFTLPMVLPYLSATKGRTRGIFFCQDYESFHHATDKTYESYLAECPTYVKLYQLPIPIIAQSQAVRKLIEERTGVQAHVVPVGLNKAVFYPRPRLEDNERKRVLMVGNYLMPYKGMRDGWEALRLLNEKLPVQLVMITQESRNRQLFADLPFPVEIHFRPTEERIPDIMATCDAYVCTSWYEGLGLPALEAFCCGLPVVSTRTFGVDDYGVDGENLLLSNANDAADLCDQLERLLTNRVLEERLRQAAFKTVENDYNWLASVRMFHAAIEEIDRTYSGCGDIDAREMQKLLDELEREGNLTPIEVFRAFQAPATQLKTLCEEVIETGHFTVAQRNRVLDLRQKFGEYLHNPQAEYHEAFKTKYDLCNLILGLQNNPKLGEYLQIVLNKDHRGNTDSPSLSEIRYSVE